MWKVNPITTKVDTNKNIVNIVANPVVVTKMNVAVKSPKIMGPFVVRVPPAKRGIVPAPPFQVNKMPTFNKTTYIAANAAVPFNNKILMNRTFGDLKNTTTQEVKSNNFQMDFSYALVTLHRPWISGEVLENAKLWYVLGQKSGVYSSGETTATNQGLMRAFPKAMIVVKDLTITAQWSEDDRKAAQTSLGFGAFNISNSHFSESNKNQLQAPGIQILGWICEILTPKLPFNDDPLIA